MVADARIRVLEWERRGIHYLAVVGEVVQVNDVLTQMNDLLSRTLGGLVQLNWKPDPSLWYLYADEAQLELALMNLAVNARDAMPSGGSLTIACRNETNTHTALPVVFRI